MNEDKKAFLLEFIKFIHEYKGITKYSLGVLKVHYMDLFGDDSETLREDEVEKLVDDYLGSLKK